MLGGKPSCPKWGGIWITGNYRKRLDDRQQTVDEQDWHAKPTQGLELGEMKSPVPVVMPGGCKSFKCEVCGPPAKRKWYKETKEAFIRLTDENPHLEVGMLTLTLRTKHSEMSWQRYIAVHDITTEDLELANQMVQNASRTTMVQECNKYQRLMRRKYAKTELDPYVWAGPIFRNAMDNKTFSKYLNSLRKPLWDFIKEELTDMELYYRGVIEFTKQGMPHMHMIMAVPRGRMNRDVIARKWTSLTLDSNQIHWRPVDYKTWDIGGQASYIAKYLLKSKFDEEGWKGIRRHFKSISLKLPVFGNEITLRYTKAGTGIHQWINNIGYRFIDPVVKQFNAIAYRKARARAYYYTKKAEDKTKNWNQWE